MAIASILVLVILALCYASILFFRCRKGTKRYELELRFPLLLKIMAHGCFLVGVGFSILAVVVISLTGEKSNNLPFVFVGGGLGIMGLFFVFLVHSGFEAIDGDTIYIRTFFRIRALPIEDVRTIDDVGRGYQIMFKGGRGISIVKEARGADRFVEMIKERKSNPVFSLSPNSKGFDPKEVFSPEECEQLDEIGKRVRADFSKRQKRLRVAMVAIFLGMTALAIGVGLSMYLTSKKPIWILLMISPLLFFFPILAIFSIIKSNLETDVEHDDSWLGYKYRFYDKRVKGCAKQKLVLHLSLSISLLGCALLTGLISGFAGGFVNPVAKEELALVSGELEYFRVISDRYDHSYAIGIKGDVTEYRIDSMYVPYFDAGFAQEVSTGTVVEVFVKAGYDPISIEYEGRTGWTHAYGVRTLSKNYFTFEDYQTKFEQNRIGSIAVFAVGLSISALCIVWIGISRYHYSKDSKKETLAF